METKNNVDQNKKDARKVGSLLYAGCMFIGLGIGWYIGNPNTGLFIGLGVGAILWAVAAASISNRK